MGRRRIAWLAATPANTVTALPALHRGRFDADLLLLQRICHQRQVQGLVVGLPLDAVGEPTAQAVHC